MDRYSGMYDIFLGIEHWMKEGKMDETSIKKRRSKDGGLQQTQQEPSTKVQSVRTGSTRQVVSLWYLKTAWDLRLIRKKERSSQLPVMWEESPLRG